MDGIRERENQLLLMKKQQAAMEAMSGQYEDQLKEMTKRIHAIEAVECVMVPFITRKRDN